MHSRCCELLYGRRKIFRELLLKSVEECCDTRNIFANRHFCYRRMCHKRKRIRHLSRKPGQKVPFCSGQVMLRIDGIASRRAKKRYSCKARLIIEFQIDGKALNEIISKAEISLSNKFYIKYQEEFFSNFYFALYKIRRY